MPSKYAEPTIAELEKAFHDAVRSRSDRYADGAEGSVYDHFAGVGAILWNRQAKRDTDLYRSIYFASAEGDALTSLLSGRYSFDRVLDASGVGTAVLRRPTAAASFGTIWAGTRIAVVGPLVEPRRYVVASNHAVAADSLYERVDVYAEQPGTGSAIAVDATSALKLRIDDPLWDATWYADSLTCADGSDFESASVARSRFRETRQNSRTGFADAIVSACQVAGAANAVIFTSDYAGDAEDYGINVAYVGDEGYSGATELVRKVSSALESTRVLGDQLQVRPLSRVDLVIHGTAYLWDSPARVNQDATRQVLNGATKAYFDGASSGYSYNRDALGGWLLQSAPSVQYVDFTQPSSDAGVVSLVNGRLVFPASLSRYFVSDANIYYSLQPPL